MDPLRPFTTLIHTLWASSKPRAAGTRPTPIPAMVIAGVPSIESRLRRRLGTLSPWQPNRAREIFVETVLANALGAELEADPDFQPWVREVSAHLASVQEVSSRLDDVLQRLQRDPSSP